MADGLFRSTVRTGSLDYKYSYELVTVWLTDGCFLVSIPEIPGPKDKQLPPSIFDVNLVTCPQCWRIRTEAQ